MREIKQKPTKNAKQPARTTSQSAGPQSDAVSHPILRLQRTIGNRAVTRLLQRQAQADAAPPAPGNSEKEAATEAPDVKEKYFSIVAKGEDYYMEAIQFLIDTFKLDASHVAEMFYDGSLTTPFGITQKQSIVREGFSRLGG